jgi:hypothetical protein
MHPVSRSCPVLPLGLLRYLCPFVNRATSRAAKHTHNLYFFANLLINMWFGLTLVISMLKPTIVHVMTIPIGSV